MNILFRLRACFSFDLLRTILSVADAGSTALAAGRDLVRQSQYSRQ